MEQEKISDSPHVIAPPPLIYIGGLIFGLLLHSIKPLEFLPKTLPFLLGIMVIIISIILVAMAMRSFVKAKTNIDVRKPTIHIVTTGPYRFTRNPIYLAMTLFVVGIAFWLNEFWILITLIPTIFMIRYGVIKREELYLTKKFGEEYAEYKKSTRRWL